MPKNTTIGVDLGGTKIEVAVLELVSRNEVEVIVRRRTPTRRELGYEAIVAATDAFVREVAQDAGVDLRSTPIGVGMPGGIDARGRVKNSNTTCLNGEPFRTDLARRLDADVVFENDANCFALAEAVLGAARPFAEGLVFGIILGTGVGGGWVRAGEVWGGRHGIAGEWGHHAVVWPNGRGCYCGQTGCVEAYLSGPAAEAAYLARSGTPRGLAEIAARADRDEEANAILCELAEVFGRAVANVIDVMDPAAIVLGGGAANLALWFDEGRRAVAARVFEPELTTPLLRPALGDSAGVLGAGLLAGWRSTRA